MPQPLKVLYRLQPSTTQGGPILKTYIHDSKIISLSAPSSLLLNDLSTGKLLDRIDLKQAIGDICRPSDDGGILAISGSRIYAFPSLETEGFRSKSNKLQKPEGLQLASCALSSDGVLAAAGTEKLPDSVTFGPDPDAMETSDSEEDSPRSFILFYDNRKQQLLGSYSESHSDAINTLEFVPENRDALVSGGADGLVNVFDLKAISEDDALQQCFNAESSVSRAKIDVSTKILDCVTDDGNFFSWDVVEGDQLKKRDDFKDFSKISANSVLVDTFRSGSDAYFGFGNGLLCKTSSDGSKIMSIGVPAEEVCLRSVDYCEKSKISVLGYDDGSLTVVKLGLRSKSRRN